jgi:hypothetical protein
MTDRREGENQSGPPVGKLELNRETLRDLTETEADAAKGGLTASCGGACRIGATNGCGGVVGVSDGGTCATCGTCLVNCQLTTACRL